MLRSGLFAAGFIAATALLTVLLSPALFASRRAARRAGAVWGHVTIFLLRALAGIRHEIRGPLPPPGCIVACKHQSAWETLALAALLADPVYVVKRELLAVPGVGWYFRRAGQIAVDRQGGASALRHMAAGAKAALAAGAQVVVFPEGTRVAPGARRPYHPGVAALYRETGAAVVPAAHNSGRHWSRRGFRMRPGTIRLQFLEPIPPGMDRRAFMACLEERIEEACREIDTEDRARMTAGAGVE